MLHFKRFRWLCASVTVYYWAPDSRASCHWAAIHCTAIHIGTRCFDAVPNAAVHIIYNGNVVSCHEKTYYFVLGYVGYMVLLV